jgi:AcrR family transcriptional regulator
VTTIDGRSRPKRQRRGRPANGSSDDTVAAVLAAARRLFAARGYAATSNRAIAEAAGLTHTAIYNHFGSKPRLFTAVFVDVQDLLVAELERAAARPEQGSFPGVLLAALEALRSADPSYVELLASMYVEVRRHPELQGIFQGGAPFPIVEVLRNLAGGVADGDGGTDDALWFWIAFALGVAQLGALADEATFSASIHALRRHLAVASGAGVVHPNGNGRSER